MNHKEPLKRKIEKKEKVISVARDLFLKEGIQNVSMNEIAASSSFGVASLYRYFKTKTNLVIEVGISLWNKVKQDLLRIEKESLKKSGFYNLKQYIDYYVSLFQKEPNFFRFIHLFDDYVLSEKINKDKLASYNQILLEIQDIFKSCLKRGQEDNTIRKDFDFTTTYYAFSKALLSLSQKLILEGDLLTSDEESSPLDQLNCLKDLMLNYIQKGETEYGR